MGRHSAPPASMKDRLEDEPESTSRIDMEIAFSAAVLIVMLFIGGLWVLRSMGIV